MFFYSESFWKNPQFQLVLTEKDHSDEDGAVEVEVEDEDEDEDDEGEDDEDDEPMTQEEKKRAEKQKQKAKQCTVLVELLQKNRRQKDKINFLYVGFHIYKVTSPRLLPFWFTEYFGFQHFYSVSEWTHTCLCVAGSFWGEYLLGNR